MPPALLAHAVHVGGVCRQLKCLFIGRRLCWNSAVLRGLKHVSTQVSPGCVICNMPAAFAFAGCLLNGANQVSGVSQQLLDVKLRAGTLARRWVCHLCGADCLVAQRCEERLAGKGGYECRRRLLVVPVHHRAHRASTQLLRCRGLKCMKCEKARPTLEILCSTVACCSSLACG